MQAVALIPALRSSEVAIDAENVVQLVRPNRPVGDETCVRAVSDEESAVGNIVDFQSVRADWRRRMGIEPTDDGGTAAHRF